MEASRGFSATGFAAIVTNRLFPTGWIDSTVPLPLSDEIRSTHGLKESQLIPEVTLVPIRSHCGQTDRLPESEGIGQESVIVASNELIITPVANDTHAFVARTSLKSSAPLLRSQFGVVTVAIAISCGRAESGFALDLTNSFDRSNADLESAPLHLTGSENSPTLPPSSLFPDSLAVESLIVVSRGRIIGSVTFADGSLDFETFTLIQSGQIAETVAIHLTSHFCDSANLDSSLVFPESSDLFAATDAMWISRQSIRPSENIHPSDTSPFRIDTHSDSNGIRLTYNADELEMADRSGSMTGAVVGILVALLTLLILGFFICLLLIRRRKSSLPDGEMSAFRDPNLPFSDETVPMHELELGLEGNECLNIMSADMLTSSSDYADDADE
jgi:hypothetical protein